jgi:hypothetical protein
MLRGADRCGPPSASMLAFGTTHNVDGVRRAKYDLIVFVRDDEEIGNRAPVRISCTGKH